MQNKIKLAAISDCTGCAACGDVCPKRCISFDFNNTLHLYPNINEDVCIKCGKCMKTCPILNPDDSSESDVSGRYRYFATWREDNYKRAFSTSGGAGAAIAEWGVQNGWKVCGSLFDSEWNLKHSIGTSDIFLEKIRQSKYLQSNTEGKFKEIKNLLDANEQVIFFGTPCQIAGLLKFCGKRDTLLTVEIICHGVNSPKVWKDYVRAIEARNNSKLSSYNFRDKSRGWERPKGGPNLTVSMNFSNGSLIINPARYNLFHFWFGQHYMLREACFNCRYRKKERVGDIVIGDFWGIENILPSADIKRGISVAIATNTRSMNILHMIDCVLIEVNEDKTLGVLKGFIEKRSIESRSKDIEKMKNFAKDFYSSSFEEMVGKYPAPTPLSCFIARVKNFLHR